MRRRPHLRERRTIARPIALIQSSFSCRVPTQSQAKGEPGGTSTSCCDTQRTCTAGVARAVMQGMPSKRRPPGCFQQQQTGQARTISWARTLESSAMKYMLPASWVEISNACSLLMASSAPLIARHLATCAHAEAHRVLSEVRGQSAGSSCGVHAPEVCFGLGCCIRPDESARYSEKHNRLETRQTTSRLSCIASTAAERQDSSVHGPLLLLHAAWD